MINFCQVLQEGQRNEYEIVPNILRSISNATLNDHIDFDVFLYFNLNICKVNICQKDLWSKASLFNSKHLTVI